MNNEEAKFILSAYRPNGADAGDATFSTAIEQTRQDPTLGDWFEQEQKFDRLMTAKLNAIVPPAGLREAIIAGAKVSHVPSTGNPWWRQTAWLAAAASLAVLLAAGSLLFWPARADARELARFAMRDLDTGSQHHGYDGAERNALQASLQNPTAHLQQGVPVDFNRLATKGCRTLNFAGHEVLEVCFQRNGAWFHCYIVRRDDFSNVSTTPDFFTSGNASCAAWASAEHVFVVASKAGTSALKQLL